MPRLEEIAKIGINALRESKIIHDRLGLDGLNPVPSPNQFGEQALRADVEAEQAVLEVLRRSGLPIRVVSEEHGTTNITDQPKFFGTLDGIDGTSVYKRLPGKGRYGTMFGIAGGLNPRYQDYLFSGIMEHGSDRLWVAIKRQGSYVIEGNEWHPIRASSTVDITDDLRIYTVDNYNALARELFNGRFIDKWKKEPLSAAIAYANIASGKADAEVEVTRKGNLEQMIAYGLIAEAGGVMVDMSERSIGSQRYLKFGQQESIPLITAATPQLAREIIKLLTS